MMKRGQFLQPCSLQWEFQLLLHLSSSVCMALVQTLETSDRPLRNISELLFIVYIACNRVSMSAVRKAWNATKLMDYYPVHSRGKFFIWIFTFAY